MQSYTEWVYGKLTKNFVKGRQFLQLIHFDGTNANEILDALKKVKLGKVELRPTNITKRNDAALFRIINGTKYDMIYIEKGSWIGIKPYNFFIFRDEYINTYYKVVGTSLVPITRMGNTEVV